MKVLIGWKTCNRARVFYNTNGNYASDYSLLVGISSVF